MSKTRKRTNSRYRRTSTGRLVLKRDRAMPRVKKALKRLGAPYDLRHTIKHSRSYRVGWRRLKDGAHMAWLVARLCDCRETAGHRRLVRTLARCVAEVRGDMSPEGVEALQLAMEYADGATVRPSALLLAAAKVDEVRGNNEPGNIPALYLANVAAENDSELIARDARIVLNCTLSCLVDRFVDCGCREYAARVKVVQARFADIFVSMYPEPPPLW